MCPLFIYPTCTVRLEDLTVTMLRVGPFTDLCASTNATKGMIVPVGCGVRDFRCRGTVGRRRRSEDMLAPAVVVRTVVSARASADTEIEFVMFSKKGAIKAGPFPLFVSSALAL